MIRPLAPFTVRPRPAKAGVAPARPIETPREVIAVKPLRVALRSAAVKTAPALKVLGRTSEPKQA